MPNVAKWTGACRAALITGSLYLAMAVSGNAWSAEPSIYMVHENWEMVVNEPETKINSPQVAFFMYPASDTDCYFQLQMNYAAEDGYSSGGFRVGAFWNESPQDEERSQIRSTLAWDNDRIQWTSAMASIDGKLMFAVMNGHGYQWGDFGGPDYLVEMASNSIPDLNNYSPQTSLDSVDIGFGKNRVSSIRLKSVRLTYTDGTTKTIVVDRSAK